MSACAKDSVPEAARPSFPGVYGINDGEEGLLEWGWATERLLGGPQLLGGDDGPGRKSARDAGLGRLAR